MNNNENKDASYEVMTERGKFTANGYTFTVKPVFWGEEPEYLEDVRYSLYPKGEEELSDEQLGKYAIALYQVTKENSHTESLNLIEKIKLKLVKLFFKDYKYYSDNKEIIGIIKWIEKKVYYKNKRIRFYDLERKFGLNKAEIIRLFKYFLEISNF